MSVLESEPDKLQTCKLEIGHLDKFHLGEVPVLVGRTLEAILMGLDLRGGKGRGTSFT